MADSSQQHSVTHTDDPDERTRIALENRYRALANLRSLSRTQYILSCTVEAGAAALVFLPVYFAYHTFDGALHARALARPSLGVGTSDVVPL